MAQLSECRWIDPPPHDAPEEDLRAYLAHLPLCERHSEIEESRLQAIRALFSGVPLPLTDLSVMCQAPHFSDPTLRPREGEAGLNIAPQLRAWANEETNQVRLALLSDWNLVQEGRFLFPHTRMCSTRFYQFGPLMDRRDRHELIAEFVDWTLRLIWRQGIEIIVSHGRTMHSVARQVIRATSRSGQDLRGIRCRGARGVRFGRATKRLSGRRVALLTDVLNTGTLAEEIVLKTMRHGGLVVLLACIVDCGGYAGRFLPLMRAWATDETARAMPHDPRRDTSTSGEGPTRVNIDRQEAVFEVDQPLDNMRDQVKCPV